MPEVINKSQHVVAAGISPRPAYSRVLCLEGYAPLTGTYYMVASPPLGNDILVTEISIRVNAKTINMANYTEVWVYAGTAIPTHIDHLDNWRNLLPVYSAGVPRLGHLFYDGQEKVRFKMDVRLKQDARKLAMLYYRSGAGTDTVRVCFRISEG